MVKINKQKGFAITTALIAVAVIAGIALAGWSLFKNNKQDQSFDKSTTNNQQSTQNSPENADRLNGIIAIDGWNVILPSTTGSSLSYKIPDSGQGSKPEGVDGGPSDLEYIYINVKGLVKQDTNCSLNDGEALGFASIYRHEEQNPTITCNEIQKLNPKTQIKIGEWYYSTNGLADEESNCFKGKVLSDDYKKLQIDFLNNFKSLSEI